MDIIQLLPDSVANQIAAGEVIQRPSSVIKELVENSVDAGAKNIKVYVVDAGRTSIQVIDDGCGMSITDARLAFERHATSKIRKAEDLFSLTTMGFRGEALPSIVAVAQVELTTRQEKDDVGTCITIHGSNFISQVPTACPVGCNFKVDNLFFNVPVRRRFLKSNTTELNNIVTAFLRIALVYPEISFSLYSNNQELYNLRASNMHQRIIDVFGKKLKEALLPVDVETTLCTIKGFVGKPESAHKKGVQQYFFVNGRYMKHPYFAKAILTSFERLVPQGEQVPFFIYFTMKPEDIDVNIHPTKTEIKFQDEQAVWQILAASVKEAVGRFSSIPSIDFDTEGRPEIPLFDSNKKIAMPDMGFNPSYNPFKPSYAATSSRLKINKDKVPDNWEALYEGIDNKSKSGGIRESSLFPANEGFSTTQDITSGQGQHPMPSGDITQDMSPAHYQYKGRYIMTAVKSGLMVIDQQRAHTRILYEKYMQRLDGQNGASQKVLFPEMVNFTQNEVNALPLIMPELTTMGFELTDLGSGSYAINAVPSGLEGLSVSHLINEMVAAAVEQDSNISNEIYSSMAISMARNASIPYGQVLSNEEMDNIVNELFACSNVNYTPDGKSIMCIIKQEDFDDLLG